MKNRSHKAIGAILCVFLTGVFCLTACSSADGKDQFQTDGSSESETILQDNAQNESMQEESTQEENSQIGMESIQNGQGENSASNIAAPSVCGRLSVKGTQLTDEQGNAVQLKGISTHGLAWFPQYVNEELFGELRREWKANVIRLAMYTAESGGYCTDGDKESLKELVKKGVEYATNQDMYVIIDWHILSDNNPNQYKKEALEFFGEMSKEFSDHNNVLYEICNEPNGGTTWEDIKSYANEVIPVIRGNAPDAVILVGTPNWSQYVNEAAADPITGYGNIMYTLHFYAATHTGALRNTMAEAIDAGLPVFVSEFGICDASGNGGIDKVQAKAWVQLLNQYKVSYVAWNLSNKEETSAIILSTVDKVSGFSKEDLSDSGRWLYSVLSNGAGTLTKGAGNSGADIPDESAPDGKEAQDTGVDGKGSASESSDTSGISGGLTESSGMVVKNGKFEINASLDEKWESDGQEFYKYTLTLKNISGKAQKSWTADVSFSGGITLSDGWNGQYSVTGNTLHISSMDYNGNVDAGGTVSDVGFIISGDSGLEIAGLQ